MTIDSIGVSVRGADHETYGAKVDVRDLCREYGFPTKIEIRGESDVGRDRYQSIKQRTTMHPLNVWAFPFVHNPNTKEIEKAGLREQADAMMYFSKLEMEEQEWGFDDIELIRCTVIVEAHQYRIKEKNLHSHHGRDHLYITLGLANI